MAGADAASAGGERVEVDLPITLGQFVKVAGLVATGGEAKLMVAEGMVRVNGEVDTRRGRKLAFGDVVSAGAEKAVVSQREGSSPVRRAGGSE